MNLDDLSDFLLVATHLGFAQASRASGRPKATLSRKVMELEASLGVRLFDRGVKKIRLTQEGSLLLERTAGPLRELTEAASVLRDGKVKPHGLLRINAPTLIGQLMMGRLAAQFTQAFPDVQVVLTLEDRQVDLISEGYDLVIRANPDPSSDLVGRCFVRDPVVIVSTPALLQRFKRAKQKTVSSLPVINRGAAPYPSAWQIASDPPTQIPIHVVLQLPHFTMIRDAVLTGLGAAKLPMMLVAPDLAAGRLVTWGPANNRPTELWALHPSRRLPSAKVTAFMQFLETEHPNSLVWSKLPASVIKRP